MNEGSLGAPVRQPIPWRDGDFYDQVSLDKELRRVFDICHGCRRCFNLCDSFPRLFDLIDDSESGELESVQSSEFKTVVDACTLCDLCFMTKCPYVPPHEFNLDFPHLMLRARAVEAKQKGISFFQNQLTQVDRNGSIGKWFSSIINWVSDRKNGFTRSILEKTLQIHHDAILPKFSSKTFLDQSKEVYELNKAAPAFGRKVLIFSTCFANYNNPAIGLSALKVLAKNGIETKVVYPRCCGMPQLEQGNIPAVAKAAESVSAELRPWIEKGYDVLALIPSCALMLKFEWPLIIPENKDVLLLSKATRDITEYIVEIDKKDGLAPGLNPVKDGVTFHIACHARAQNMGQKGAEMLRLIPDTEVQIIERCSGHGGTWGIMKENYEVALKIGLPAARRASELKSPHVISECPLAREHLFQGVEHLSGAAPKTSSFQHPIEFLAYSYGD